MAEMTADKVKTLLESFAALCGSNSKAKELCGESIKFVEQQQQQIEQQAAEIERLDAKTVKQSEKIAARENEIECMTNTQRILLAEIEQLKCCGNCKHWNGNSANCYLELKWGYNVTRKCKCDKWQGVE